MKRLEKKDRKKRRIDEEDFCGKVEKDVCNVFCVIIDRDRCLMNNKEEVNLSRIGNNGQKLLETL